MSSLSDRIRLEAFPQLGFFTYKIRLILIYNQALVFTEGEFPETKYTSFFKR
jgi:hypothetical protein